MTKGVEERVEELADRPEGYKPQGAPSYIHLLPLSEIVATALGGEQPQNRRVWEIYNALISKFGSEFNVLLDASRSEISKVAGETVAFLVEAVRVGKVKVKPGYDGVYGSIVFEETKKQEENKLSKRTLEDFF
jgi:PHP family Zn ribbon phosphoesterase